MYRSRHCSHAPATESSGQLQDEALGTSQSEFSAVLCCCWLSMMTLQKDPRRTSGEDWRLVAERKSDPGSSGLLERRHTLAPAVGERRRALCETGPVAVLHVHTGSRMRCSGAHDESASSLFAFFINLLQKVLESGIDTPGARVKIASTRCMLPASEQACACVYARRCRPHASMFRMLSELSAVDMTTSSSRTRHNVQNYSMLESKESRELCYGPGP